MGKKYYGPEIDIWSLGVILYVLVSASLPFDSDNLQHIKQKVLTCKFRIPYFMSQDCEDLINNILILNASNRFKMQQIKSHRWIKINNSSYYYSVNNNNCDSETVQITSNYDRVKSKSLKLVGNRKKSLLKHNSAISTLSLPLYSYNEDTSTIKSVQIHSDYSKKKSDSISSNIIINNNNNNNSNLNNNNNNITIKPINKPFCFFNNYTRRLSELISNSSSVDEGVESDWSSSLSSDVMSLTSSNSIQSFYLQSPSSIPKSKQINPPPPPSTTTTTTSKSSITNKKSSLLSSAFHFNRRQKFQLMKNNKTTTNNDSFDLKLIKLELETLKTKCFNENEKFKNFKPNNIENNKLIKNYSQEQTNAAYKAETLQKFKQFIFHNNSNKKNIFDYFDTTSPLNNNNISKTNKKCILKQKSSSLISLNNENIDNHEPKLHDFNFNIKNNTKSIRVHEFKFNSLRKYSMNKLV